MTPYRLISRPSMLVLLIAASGSIAAGADEQIRTPGDCGPVAIYALLRFEGRPTSLEAIAARLPAPGARGHSMRDLRDASRSFGLILDGAYLGKDPGPIDRPMIAYLKLERAGHFLVIRPVGHTGQLVQVIDSDQPTRVMDKADLVASGQWTGLVLAPRRTNWPATIALGLLAPSCLGLTGFALLRSKMRKTRPILPSS